MATLREIHVALYHVLVVFTLTFTVLLAQSSKSNPLEGMQYYELDSESGIFHTLKHDPETGMIYAGGRNFLLQLDSSLQLVNKIGNEQLAADLIGCPDCPTEISNDVKIVSINRRKKYLLSCGTANHGVCHFHSLTNISTLQEIQGETPAKYMGSKASSLIYQANDHEFLFDMVYVFQEYDHSRPDEFAPHVISLRKFTSKGSVYVLDYALMNTALHQISALNIKESLRADYYMSFVYTFKHEHYLYVLMNQQKDADNRNYIQIKIARNCYGTNNDSTFSSYAEIPLSCSYKDTLYNKVLGATVIGDTLYIIAARLQRSERLSIDQTHGTLLCFQSMTMINDYFVQGIHECIASGKHNHPLWMVGSLTSCVIDNDVSKDG